MCACLCAEWNIPVPPVHTLRNEVQSDVQGQPDRTHSGGRIAEHLSSWGEWGLRYSCCHKGDTCNNTLTRLHTHTHTHQCIKAPCLATLSISVTCVYLKGRVRNTRSRVQPCLQDKMTFSFHCLSFRYTLSLLLELPSCLWIQSCSHTSPFEKPFSFIFEQLDLQKPYVTNHDELYFWQRHTPTTSLSVYNPTP